jgi:endoglucanase
VNRLVAALRSRPPRAVFTWATVVVAVMAPHAGRASAQPAAALETSRDRRVVSTQPQPQPQPSAHVKVSQVGYLPRETKFAVLTTQPAGEVVVRRADDGRAALTVTAGPPVYDADSGDTVRAIDFSALREPGTYRLDVPGVGASYDFRVGDDAFARAFRLAMRSFTGQRCGTAVSLAPDFPQYRYDACHLAPAHFHPSSGKEGTIDCTGGWHDAGDYGRYIVNSGITTGTLLWAYERNADKLRNVNLDLPESGGRVPDVLAEIKWNLDWMLKMQDPADGGVWHKATTARFPGMIMPEKDTEQPVLIIGTPGAPHKPTAATADFAAVCAIAGRVYRPFDGAYADKCLAAAERAWAWLEKTPDNNYQQQPEGIVTGGYGDGNPSDERLWAAAELFRTTGKPVYNDYFVANYVKWTPTLKHDDPQAWPNVQNLAMYTYALSGRSEANADAVRQIKTDAIAAADGIVERAKGNGYRIPLTTRQYIWGSNGVVGNYAMMLRLAHRFEPKDAYVNAAQDALHYLLGRNAFNTSYVTHVGTRWFMNPHHRPSVADQIEQPWPGLLSGGPNAAQFGGRRRRPATTTASATGATAGLANPAPAPATTAATRPTTAPAKSWVDDHNSFTTNENAINWNAPLVFILAEALPE